MLKPVFHRLKVARTRSIFLAVMLAILCSSLMNVALPQVALTNTSSPNHLLRSSANSSCQSALAPDNSSILAVLLDRSGSLTNGTTPTDPNLYSTSVTKALADLWPGVMVVIPFSGDTLPLPVIGPATLSDPTQHADLKSQVENYSIGGNTPLAPAMQQAHDLLKRQGDPSGSRVIIITDGNPTGNGNNDGQHQEALIRNKLIGQYCSEGIPVSAFGLTINPNTSDGKDATNLLNDITNGTGSTYTNVENAKDLSLAVVKLYAQWQGLTFTQIPGKGNNFSSFVDTFATQVSFVIFRSGSNFPIKFDGPDGQPVVNGVQKSTPEDRHYEIDSLISRPLLAGTYTVNVSGDNNAQVYALVYSPLQARIVKPDTKTIAYVNEPVQIQAEFDQAGQGSITPAQNQGTMVADAKLLVNGQIIQTQNGIVLTQQKMGGGQLGPLFTGTTMVFNQVGQLQIEVVGNYQQAIRETSFTLNLLKPLPVIKPIPPPPPCTAGAAFCKILQIWHQIGTYIIIVLVLLLLFYLLSRPKPFGQVLSMQDRNILPIKLRKSFLGALFSGSTVHSDKLKRIDFGGARFILKFKWGRRAYIKAKSNVPAISVICVNKGQDILVKRGKSEPLHDGDGIKVDGIERAKFFKSDRTLSRY